MSKNTNIADLINYISVDGSGNVVLSTGQLVATQNYVTTAVSNLVASAPSTLDTLNELATALGNDANFATTVTNSIATKLPLSGGTLTGALSGTSATFSSTLAAMGSNIQFNLDGTFGANYYTMGFGGVSNGFNRISGGTGTTDGLYIMSATGRDIAFRTNGSGTTSMLVNSSGNVGIGTTSPTAKVHAVNSGNGFIYRFAGGTSSEITGGIFASTAAGFASIGTTSNHTFNIFTNDTDRLTVTSGGNVGIGTSSPSSLLDVRGVLSVGGAAGTYSVIQRSTTPSGSQGIILTAGTVKTEGGGGITFADDSNSGGTILLSGNSSDIYGGGVNLIAYGQTASANIITFATRSGAGTTAERMRITSGGLLQLINSTGIRFASGASNLNYYQEGSWTPQLYAGSTAFTMSGINDGRYVRVGNQVTISGHLQWSGGSGTGMVRIAGLPFTCSGVRSAGSMGAVSYGISFSSGYNHWILVVDPGADYIYIIQGDSTGGGYSHNAPVGSSGVIYGFSITYHTL